jgi:hypothetical protein
MEPGEDMFCEIKSAHHIVGAKPSEASILKGGKVTGF